MFSNKKRIILVPDFSSAILQDYEKIKKKMFTGYWEELQMENSVCERDIIYLLRQKMYIFRYGMISQGGERKPTWDWYSAII